MTVVITSAAHDTIIAACAATNDEACGLLYGMATRIEAAEPCRNVAADPACTFEIDPAALLAAHRRVRAGGGRIIGCFHSHPNGVAMPSPTDFALAEAGTVWVIVAGGALTAWRRDVATFSACTTTLL